MFVDNVLQNRLHEAIVHIWSQSVESNVRVGDHHHAPVDSSEIIAVEEAVFKDERVQAELKKLQLPKDTKFVCDPWIYGSDGVDDDKRMMQAFLYTRDPANPHNADSNYYAFPLSILPVLDATTMKLIRIDRIATGKGLEKKLTSKAKVHPPREYTPEHQKLRTDLKPLQVIQPQGTSFKATKFGETGHTVEWQKWFFRIGFNQREGMVLYDVRYDKRSLFYRLSLSDMNIPYADPRAPLHRKTAFDLGDVGAGIMANNLKLGCDCLGSIYYINGVISDDKGEPDPRPNAICIHEQDAGVLWKHTNYRTGRAAVVRNRELVVQSIITVANYEYILAFIFNQAGELTYEVRASGIVSTQPIDEGISVPWGTILHPGVFASHHQHIISLRIDPAIDGHSNTLIRSEAHAMPIDPFNPYGNGYTVEETTVPTSTGLNLDPDKNRFFKIANPSSLNPITGKPVAYKIAAPPFQKMLAHPTSYHHKRAEFADCNLYVTRYRDGELYPGGTYTNQSRGGHGVRTWANRKDDITGEDGKGEDIVVWVQFGLQHIVRTEDWPVMPAETIRVSLKPCNFFTGNPALDVPPSDQRNNGSVLVDGEGGARVANEAEKHLQGGKVAKMNGVVQNGCGECESG
ncbi:uncharacterized protein KY384_005986 [Bacidia gigantensis]|uniref:uncharacterized protein n=1 Tax=Bacidia gigantensis TaxID=2732470 RepID=UPI001D0416D4|nr:uncharacterized protein KY384_005986 [Bacidia gigantensis]KAG8529350.1 hypothetical protein KY384_005986 [Bacidia gigantensis]